MRTLEEYDKKVRQRLSEIDGENADRGKLVREQLAELAPDAQAAVKLETSADGSETNSFAAKRREQTLMDMRKRRLETIDDNEPFYAWATSAYGDSDAPYYDPSAEPAGEWSHERDELLYGE